MKKKLVRSLVNKALGGGFCVCVAASALGTTNYVIDTYPVATGTNDVTKWTQGWGSAPFTVTFDPTHDANNDPSSGSVQFDVDFSGVTVNPNNLGDLLMMRQLSGNSFDDSVYIGNTNSEYSGYSYDILWWTNSAIDTNGTFMKFNSVLLPGFDFDNGTFYVPTNPPNTWFHVVQNFPPSFTAPDLTGVAFYLYEYNTSGENVVRGPVRFWLDNLTYIASVAPPPPPPKLSIRKFSGPQGLQETASVFGAAGSRQNIRTLNSFPAFDSVDPSTYSVTISSFPDASHAGFEAHLFLVPGIPGGESAADHNEPSVIYVRIADDTNGVATASFMYKTNNPGASGDAAYGGANTLAVITNSTAVGKWSLTFSSGTHLTLTTPGGSSTNFTMNSDAATFFTSPLVYYVGVEPNNTNNIGQYARYSRAQNVSGTTTNLDDTFPSPTLDLNTWQFAADNSASIFVVPSASAYWINWTIPDTGFDFQTSTNLSDTNSWVDASPAIFYQNNVMKEALMTNDVSPLVTSYFRLLRTNSP
jgi:hypothetical protein